MNWPLELPPADFFMSFLLDQKGPKNQGPIEICRSNLRNFGKKYFSAEFLRLLRDGKFQNGRLKKDFFASFWLDSVADY
jgi:hypothetical protein